MRVTSRLVLLMTGVVVAAASMARAQQVVPFTSRVPIQTPGVVVSDQGSSDLPKVLALTPLRVEVVLQRYANGDTLIDSWPFVLSARADDRPVTLRIGVQVPVERGSTLTTAAVGTNIDATVSLTRDQRYRALITLQDTSIVPGDSKTGSIHPAPTVREFSTTSLVVVKDGQTAELNVGYDKVTGETLKAKVTITALK
jgi:hypothetical protein